MKYHTPEPPPKTECGCPSGGGIKNATPPMEERRKKDT